MTDTVPTSRMGLQQGDTDLKEIFRLEFGGDILACFERDNWLQNLTFSKFVTGSKGARFPVLGRGKGGRHSVGENLSVPDLNGTGVNAAKNVTVARTYRDIFPDEDPLQYPIFFNRVDLTQADAAQEQRRLEAQQAARNIQEMVEVQWHLTLAQTIMKVDELKSAEMGSTFNDALQDTTNKNWTRRKAVAALKAGLTDSAAATSTTIGGQTFKGNSFGYHINALSSATAIRSVLFIAQRYFNHLRIPKQGRFCLIASDLYFQICEAAGLYTGTSGPVTEFSSQINGGGGDLGNNVVPMIAGWALIPDTYLTGVASTGLGSQAESILVSSPTSNDEKKYQPAGTPDTLAMFANSVVIQKMVQHTPGGAGTQPDTWAEWRDLLDKIAIMFGHASMLGQAKLDSVTVDIDDMLASMNGYIVTTRWHQGFGILRSDAGLYVATAKVTTA